MTLFVSDKSTVWYIKRLTSQDWLFLKPFMTSVTPGNDSYENFPKVRSLDLYTVNFLVDL